MENIEFAEDEINAAHINIREMPNKASLLPIKIFPIPK
jgi:hypothetical protein